MRRCFHRLLLAASAAAALAAAVPPGTAPVASARVLDTVVAFIDNRAITLSELNVDYEEARKTKPDITRQQVLNTMINRRLLLREARRLRLEGDNEEEVLQDYIDLKVEAFIRITDQEIRNFYQEHGDEFGDKQLSEVRGDIEAYLREREINHRLKEHLKELRSKAYIKVLFDGAP